MKRPRRTRTSPKLMPKYIFLDVHERSRFELCTWSYELTNKYCLCNAQCGRPCTRYLAITSALPFQDGRRGESCTLRKLCSSNVVRPADATTIMAVNLSTATNFKPRRRVRLRSVTGPPSSKMHSSDMYTIACHFSSDLIYHPQDIDIIKLLDTL